MNPLNDLVCNLLETPFSRWCAEDKQDILKYRRTTSHINITTKKVKSGGRSYNIQFQDSWYADCNWLCGSHYNEKLYCWPCLLLGNKKPAWNSTGFCDFRNVNRGLYSHADSAEHIKCILQLKALQKNMNTIADALKESYRLYESLKWKWGGHVVRMDHRRWTHRLTLWDPRIGRRRVGRQTTRWADFFKKKAGSHLTSSTRDRQLWRNLEATVLSV
ncbi:hypothetical protein ANN_11731 [Periplaneta americana]|uniref:TTF-type domain-containing protein n=1 Tax=Periplaneta americana TaxID=6978 RepID=A0ABQ8T7B7_PERAM|nr:hypothetical protein ANN_11731 [Periplaneta americana]